MTLHPKIIDLTLGRVTRLLAALDHPERRLPPVIHVAGTNGKGSTIAMIRAGLEAAGKRVHVYTSPHLARFHERIRLAGEVIDEDRLVRELERCEAANGSAAITYFEITTVAAILAMSETPADYCLLEVGLGGRLDATNVIDTPQLCVITPVSIDHQQYLGETLAEIAAEKAGILKRVVPCIVGPQADIALDVITTHAAKHLAPLLIHGQDWQIWEENGRIVFQDASGLLDLPRPNLIGAHQVQNAGAAIMALRHLGFDEDICEAAITQAQWPARMQRLRKGPLVEQLGPERELWLDGGHNAAAGAALVEALGRLPDRPLYMVVGMLRTKDATSYLRHFVSEDPELFAVSIPDQAATLSADETVTAAEVAGLRAQSAASVKDAIAQIARNAPAHARVLICGSLYLAGAILRENG